MLRRIEIPNSVTVYDPTRLRPVKTRARYRLRTPRQGTIYRVAKAIPFIPEVDGKR